MSEKVKKFVSETTSSVGTVTDKALKSSKSALAEVASSELLTDLGNKASESAENVLGKPVKFPLQRS